MHTLLQAFEFVVSVSLTVKTLLKILSNFLLYLTNPLKKNSCIQLSIGNSPFHCLPLFLDGDEESDDSSEEESSLESGEDESGTEEEVFDDSACPESTLDETTRPL